MSASKPSAASAAPSASGAPQIAPQSIHYALSNTYTRLPTTTAPLDYTQRHRKVHDWVLYVDILPGSNPDLVDRVTFEMRDDSFRGMSFTCHCPIRVRDSVAASATNAGSNTTTEGQTKARSPGETTAEQKLPPSNPRPRHSSRYRFSTRQQTYGAVDVRIIIRGVGGSKSILEYAIVLKEGAIPEIYGVFVEKRPNCVLRPIKMTDGKFRIRLILNVDSETNGASQWKEGAENRELLQQIAESIYSRSKRPMRAVLRNLMNGESWEEEWFGKMSRHDQGGDDDLFWTLSFLPSSLKNANHKEQNPRNFNEPTTICIDSPNLAGGEGLNECYKIIEGLPSYLSCSTQSNTNQSTPYTFITQQQHHSSLHVQIDVSNLTILQIIKVCQNYIKYEEAIDSFMPWYRREDICPDCHSNKLAMTNKTLGTQQPQQQPLNNRMRNSMIAKCTSFRDLIACLNPEENKWYKLHLRHLIHPTTSTTNSSTNNRIFIEFRQHPSSKDKSTTTHWIRFCMAFVKNSARLRAPNPLKNTTSIEDEFDLLFEYVVKDRAVRNFYQGRRDGFAARDEEERLERLALAVHSGEDVVVGEDDNMSISDEESEDEDGCDSKMASNLKREADFVSDPDKIKRHCF